MRMREREGPRGAVYIPRHHPSMEAMTLVLPLVHRFGTQPSRYEWRKANRLFYDRDNQDLDHPVRRMAPRQQVGDLEHAVMSADSRCVGTREHASELLSQREVASELRSTDVICVSTSEKRSVG